MSSKFNLSKVLSIGSAIGALYFLWPAPMSWGQVGPPAAPAPVADQATNDAVEPLTSGPIHEAFAQPLQYDITKPLIVSQRPPELIQEVPPDARPEGDNVIWIPGYWGWDDDRHSFIWISGVSARCASGASLGVGLLDAGRRGISMGPRLLEFNSE